MAPLGANRHWFLRCSMSGLPLPLRCVRSDRVQEGGTGARSPAARYTLLVDIVGPIRCLRPSSNLHPVAGLGCPENEIDCDLGMKRGGIAMVESHAVPPMNPSTRI